MTDAPAALIQAQAASQAACNAFHAVLVKHYGEKRAGDERYRVDRNSPTDVRTARDAYHAASKVFRQAFDAYMTDRSRDAR